MSNKLKIKDLLMIEKHYAKYFTLAGAKEGESMWKPAMEGMLDVSLKHYLPTEQFPYHIFATVGMSAYKMHTKIHDRIELIMLLPKEWKLDDESLKDEKWEWPLNILYVMASFPYMTNSSLDYNHTASLSEDFTPFTESTNMSCAIITEPKFFDDGILSLEYGFPKKKINFLALSAITKEEYIKYKEMGNRDEFIQNVMYKDKEKYLVIQNNR